ncbi:uncharacterized protein F5Z01DRAFT_491878 [Emericellopsis atlantica]|uniref:Uncharacterized protein n=1 Tax=Emericellopsis atlantica TaxID=2614577 RepID=A0A9P8CS64_9HYPO|nr:uncharacterized protein F5Z01DRAFT_491878 [Emericellopsis atlantica]KAG9256890.1 hypothetical protein F5Z01DRAFT_491878 [Emericellopsis atlantica]
MCITLTVHHTTCPSNQPIVHIPETQFDIYHPFHEPSCDCAQLVPEGREWVRSCNSHGPCCKTYSMEICDNRVKYGYYKCLKYQGQAHLVLRYGSRGPLTGSTVSKDLPKEPKILGNQDYADAIMRVLHEVLETGVAIRETQQKEHIAWPSDNEDLRNGLLSKPEHHQLAQEWETNITAWRRMCLQVADFPPYHRAKATGEDWLKITALPQWLAAFRANLVDYTEEERVELADNPDVEWLSFPEDNDFSNKIIKEINDFSKIVSDMMSFIDTIEYGNELDTEGESLSNLCTPSCDNRFVMESPCGTTFVIDNEMESDVIHECGDEASQTELSMAEPDEGSFSIDIHRGCEDEGQHGEPLLPYVLNQCRLHGEETGVGQAWHIVLRHLYASGSLDTEIAALCEEAGLVLDMYQEAADAKQEQRAGELYDEASMIAKFLQEYRERDLQYQLDTGSCASEPIYGPTAMSIRRPRFNRALERHARLLGIEKAYLTLPPQELYVHMLNDPNTTALSIEEILEGHMVPPWGAVSLASRAPSMGERELDSEDCLDAVRRPQSDEFKIRGASGASATNHTMDKQVTDGMTDQQLNTPSGFIKRKFSKAPPWRQHAMVTKSLHPTAGPSAESDVTHNIVEAESSPPLSRSGVQGEQGIEIPRHLSNESCIFVSSDPEESNEKPGTPPTGLIDLEKPSIPEVPEEHEDLGYEAGYESVTSSEGHVTPLSTAPNMPTLSLLGGSASGAPDRSERPRTRHGCATRPSGSHRFSPCARPQASNVQIFKMRSTGSKSRTSISSSEGSTDAPPHRGRRPARGYVHLPESDGDKAPPSNSTAPCSSNSTNKPSLTCEERKASLGCSYSEPSLPGSDTSSDGMIPEEQAPYSPTSASSSDVSKIEEPTLSASSCSSEPLDEKSRSNKRKRSDKPETEGPLHKRVAGKGPRRTPVKTVAKMASVPRRESPRLRGKARRNYCE